MFQREKTKDFVTYLQAGGLPIIIVGIYQYLSNFDPPKKLWPQKAILGISEKIEFTKNGPTM